MALLKLTVVPGPVATLLINTEPAACAVRLLELFMRIGDAALDPTSLVVEYRTISEAEISANGEAAIMRPTAWTLKIELAWFVIGVPPAATPFAKRTVVLASKGNDPGGGGT